MLTHSLRLWSRLSFACVALAACVTLLACVPPRADYVVSEGWRATEAPLRIHAGEPRFAAVDCTVNGVEVSLFLDTGAVPSLSLTGTLAEQLGVRFTGDSEELTFVGYKARARKFVTSVTIGDIHYPHVEGYELPDNFTGFAPPDEADDADGNPRPRPTGKPFGLIGLGLIRQFCIRFDWPRDRLLIGRTRRDVPHPDGENRPVVRIDLQEADGQYHVRCEADPGAGPVGFPMLIDTCASNSSFTPDAAVLEVLSVEPAPPGRVRTVSGGIRMGPLTVLHQFLVFGAGDRHHHGVIGWDLLRHSLRLIDFPRRTMDLVPDSSRE